MIAVAVVMTILGTRLTGLSPRIATWSPTLPMGLGRQLGLGDGASGAYSDARAAGLGAASFFLPCGFTQAVQIYALSTGSPLFAGRHHGGLRDRDRARAARPGRAPGRRAEHDAPDPPAARRGRRHRLRVRQRERRAPALRASRLPSLGVGTGGCGAAAARAPWPPTGRRRSPPSRTRGGYSPGNVSIYAGIPTRWTIESSTTATCAAFLVVPEPRDPAPAPRRARTRSTCRRCRRARWPTPARWGCTAGGSRSWSAPPERAAEACRAADTRPGARLHVRRSSRPLKA